MKNNGTWCQRTSRQLGAQCETITQVVTELNRQNIPNWLCYGSALAVIRAEVNEKDPSPIPWESDDDLCVYESDSQKIEEILTIFSKKNIFKTEVLTGNVVRYRIERVDHLAGNEWKLEIYAHKIKTYFGTEVMIQNVAPNRDRTKRDLPYSFIEPISRNHSYCGQHIFSVPNQKIKYVSHLFGTTWKMPLASFTGSNGYRRFTCLLSAPFSNNVPKLRIKSNVVKVKMEA
jgi:hypothetical protein